MSYLLTYSLASSTARKLAEKLEINLVTAIPSTALDSDLIINWGSRGRIPPRFSRVVNRNLVTKLDAMKKLQAQDVPVPRFIEGPFITRKLRHRGGRDIRSYNRRFAVETIPKDAEFRVEVFNGKVFRIHEKKPKYPPANQPFNWNRENTHWVTVGSKNIREAFGTELIDLGRNAVECLGYDFGAVDIIRGNGQYYVLEVNSAPALGDAGIRKYVYRFRKIINDDHR